MGQHTPPQLKKIRRLSPTPRLKAGTLRVLRPDGVYVGNEERAVLLQSNGAAAVTALLDGTHSRIDIAAETKTPKERIEQILIALDAASLLDRDYQECAFTPAIAARMVPELDVLSHRPSVDDGGAALLRRRQEHRVDIYGADRVGMTMATLLAASGIGAIQVIDNETTTQVDVIGSSVRFSDVGADRRSVALHRIKEAMPVEPSVSNKKADLIVFTTPPMPEQVMEFGLTGIAHLVILAAADGVVVGPLVVPGTSACTRCIALRKVDHDRYWGPVELARLQQRQTPSALAAQLAATHGCTQVLAYIDTGECAAINGTLHISLDDGFVRPRAWNPHRLCGCAWQSDLPPLLL